MEYLSQLLKKNLLFVIIFLVSSLSFGLGYYVSNQFNHPPIIIEKCSQNGQ